MAGKVRGLTVAIGANTDKLHQALQEIEKQSKSITKELTQVNKALKLDDNAPAALKEKQVLLNQQIEVTNQKLEVLKKTQREIKEDAKAGNATAENVKAINYEVEKAEKQLKNFKNQLIETKNINFNKMTDSLKNAGASLTKFVSLPVAGALTLATKSAIEFESAFAGVKKTVEATPEELEQIKNQILEMSHILPASAVEISSVAEAAGQLGIEVPNITSFTQTMINLGEATNLSSDEAATQLARFANIVQMSQKDFDKLGSVIVDLGNNMATTESEITAMGLRIAGAGKQVGMTEAQIMSFAAALSSVGIQAEAGGSAFSKLISTMQLSLEKGGEQLKYFASVSKMSVEQFKELFEKDASQAIISFINGLGSLEDSEKSAIGILDEMGLSEIRMRDTLLRASGAGDLFNRAIEIGNKAWSENIALTNEANQRYSTTESKIKMAKNSLVDMGIKIGNVLLPTVTKFANALGGVFNSISKLDEGTQNFIVSAGLAAVALGPLTSGISKFMSTISTISTLIGVSAPFMVGIMGLITALGLLTNEFIKNNEKFQDLNREITTTEEVVERANEKLNSVGEGTKERLSEISESFRETLQSISSGIDESQVAEKFQNILNYFDEANTTYQEQIMDKYAVAKEALENSSKTAEEKAKDLDIIRTKEKEELDSLKVKYDEYKDKVLEVTGSNGENIENMTSEAIIRLGELQREFTNIKLDDVLADERTPFEKFIQKLREDLENGKEPTQTQIREFGDFLTKETENLRTQLDKDIENAQIQIKLGINVEDNEKLIKELEEQKENLKENYNTLIAELADSTKIEWQRRTEDFSFSKNVLTGDELLKDIEKDKQFKKDLGAGLERNTDEFIMNQKKIIRKGTKEIGDQALEGFKSGTKDEDYYNTGVSNAKAYLKGQTDTFDIHSPSKKGKENARYYFQGFQLGTPDDLYTKQGRSNAESYLKSFKMNYEGINHIEKNINPQNRTSTISNTVSKNVNLNVYAQELNDSQIQKLVNILNVQLGSEL